MKPFLTILRTKLFLLGFFLTSTVIIATTITLEIKNNSKEVVLDKTEIKKEKKKATGKIILSQARTQLQADGPTLTSDAADYAPGTTATLTGSGFLPGESVRMQVLHADYHEGDPIGEDHEPWYINADENGNFETTWHVCEDDCVGELLRATADGQDPTEPARHAEVLFTDADATTVTAQEACSGNSSFEFSATTTAPNVRCLLVQFPAGFVVSAISVSSPAGWSGTILNSTDITISSPTDLDDAILNFTVNFSTFPSAGIYTAKSSSSLNCPPNANGGNDISLVIVEDNAPPVISANGTTLTLGCNPFSSDINAALGTASATDNCSTPTVTSDDGSVTSDGCSRSATRTFTATDGAGLTATAARTVTWKEDHTGPEFTSELSEVPLGCNPDASDITGALGTAEATDACGSTTVTASDGGVNSSTCSRSQTRTFTARDECGNSSTASRTVTWTEDHGAPVITANGTTFVLGCNPAASDINAALGSAIASDNCGVGSPTASDGAVTGTCTKSQTRTFNVSDACGNSAVPVTRIVTWTEDHGAPVITANGTTLTLGCNPAASDINAALGSATASDNCGVGSPTASDGAITGTCAKSQTRTFNVSDACGNSAVPVTRTVTWTEDHGAPVITANGTTLVLGCNPATSDIIAALGSATASDNCGVGSPTASDGAVTGTCTKSQTRTFNVSDACGNSAVPVTRTVTWTEDHGAPVITANGTTLVLGCNPAASDINAALGSATASDNCGVGSPTASDGAVTGTCTKSQTRTFNVSDACGNSAVPVTRTVTWKEDNSGPTLTTGGTTTSLGCNPSPSDINGALGTATATDACSTPTVCSSDGSISSSTCSRSQTRTFTAKDGCNNTSTASRTVTWTVDPTPPTIPTTFVSKTCLWPPNHKMVDIELAASDGCGSIASSSITITSNEPANDIGDGNTEVDWEIVDGNSIRLRAERSGVFDLQPADFGRIYTINYSVTDACGNTASAANTVTVAHNITTPKPGCAFPINTTVNLAGTFWDVPGKTHTAKWVVDATTVNGTITLEPSGNKMGKVTGSFKPTVAGVYKLKMNVIDQFGVTSYATTSGDYEAYFVAYDPKGGYTYGAGQFISPAGALTAQPNLTDVVTFGFASNYYKNATNPKGETELDFKLTSGDYSFGFNALNYEYLVVNGSKAQYKGTGKTIINGIEQGGLAFILTVIDGKTVANPNGVDKIRMKIYNKNTGAVIYDNQMGASETVDPTTPVDEPNDDGSDIVVVSGTPTSVNSDITRSAQMESVPETTLFKVTAHPNPTEHQFTLYLEGGSNEKVQLVVFDAIGRQVKKIEKGDATGAIQFGEDLKVGVYFVEVRQGANRKILKLVKQ